MRISKGTKAEDDHDHDHDDLYDDFILSRETTGMNESEKIC